MPHCSRCNRGFKSEPALRQHRDDSKMHHVCWDCNIDFTTAEKLTQHYNCSPLHWYCDWCHELFDNRDDLDDHDNEEHSLCGICGLTFVDEDVLHDHRLEEHADRYCGPCKRIFPNNNNLRHHERSTLHQGRTVDCPMKGCTKSFVSRAALVFHLESGGCRSRITRDVVNRIVTQLDPDGVITNPARLLGGGGAKPELMGTWATERAWNGSRFECYLCHRTYASLSALNQHLQSPAHSEKLYRCPAGWQGCGAEFKTLSGFCQHVESEQCSVRRFQGRMDKYIDQMRAGARCLRAA